MNISCVHFLLLICIKRKISYFRLSAAKEKINVFFFGSVISHWALVFQTGEQEFYRIPITNVLVSVTDQYKSLTLATDNHYVLKPYTCRP